MAYRIFHIPSLATHSWHSLNSNVRRLKFTLAMPFVVITGGPGSGKTTLLRELAGMGFRTVSESARAIIAERVASGRTPRPEPAAFANEILRRDMEKYGREVRTSDCVFFDRGMPEALAMAHEVNAISIERRDELERQHRFHPQVFILPPWSAIYSQDSERDHSFDHAVAVYRRIVNCYQAPGYVLKLVPPGLVEQRAQHVLAVIAHGAA